MNEIVCFHNPWEENGWLSNWHIADFVVDGITFSSVEKYMMFRKALLFGDKRSADMILRVDNPEIIKNIGRQVSGYYEQAWNGTRQLVVFRGNFEKFRQNAELRKLLIDTDDSILAECAVKDRVWGIGLSMHNPDRFDMSKWKGTNLLGWTLVKVRRYLADENWIN